MHRQLSVRSILSMSLIISGVSMPLRADTSAAELGVELRDALGFGWQTLGALGVSEAAYGHIVADASSYCDQNRQTVEPLVVTVRAARCGRVNAYETGGDIESAEHAYAQAVQALSTACSTVVQTMSGRLTEPQQTKQARVAANVLLDPALALLDLDSEQRQSILAAQRTRDQILKHSKLRKDLDAVAQAMAAFRTAVLGTLTQGQVSEFAGLETNLHDNASTAQDQDESSVNP